MRRAKIYRLTATALVFSWILFIHAPPSSQALDLEIPLIPDIDQIGGQIETVQVYRDADGDRTMFGIYDTGASVISVSALDQELFAIDIWGGNTTNNKVPTLVANGAYAQGIDGDIIGDVSTPGTILADGLHAFTFDIDNIFNFGINTANAIPVPNVQAFLGTEHGSPSLPSITGTPIHSTGKAAKIDMLGYVLDFGGGLVINMPDLNFVTPNTPQAALPATTLTPTPVRIPLQLIGENNYANPGSNVTAAPNPVQTGVTLHQGLNPGGGYAVNMSGKTFLFDTGAQMSIIDQQLAENLGLTQQTPLVTVPIQGAAGNPLNVSCYVLDALELPRDDDGNGVIDGTLKITQAPIFVLDLSDFGLDGILGMNLWNTAAGMLYDPTDPNDAYVSLTFTDDPNRGITQDEIDELYGLNPLFFPIFAGALHDINFASIPFVPSEPVPEPSQWILLIFGVTCLTCHGLWKKFCHRSQ